MFLLVYRKYREPSVRYMYRYCTVFHAKYEQGHSMDCSIAQYYSINLGMRIGFMLPLIVRMERGAWTAWVSVRMALRYCSTSLGQYSGCCWLAYGARMVHGL